MAQLKQTRNYKIERKLGKKIAFNSIINVLYKVYKMCGLFNFQIKISHWIAQNQFHITTGRLAEIKIERKIY